jgi:uncharacterized protein YdeI (YjbR/CyaY-like superfamily)
VHTVDVALFATWATVFLGVAFLLAGAALMMSGNYSRLLGRRLSEMNRERMRRLIAAGRMTRAGLARIAHVFDRRKDTKKELRWEVPADIRRRLERDPAVWSNYRRFPESYRRIRIGWITAARRRPEAFQQRLRYFLEMTAQNKRFGMVQ